MTTTVTTTTTTTTPAASPTKAKLGKGKMSVKTEPSGSAGKRGVSSDSKPYADTLALLRGLETNENISTIEQPSIYSYTRRIGVGVVSAIWDDDEPGMEVTRIAREVANQLQLAPALRQYLGSHGYDAESLDWLAAVIENLPASQEDAWQALMQCLVSDAKIPVMEASYIVTLVFPMSP